VARERVLIVGVSTRALAESAWRSGFECSSADAFGDLDQRQWSTSLGLRRDLGVRYSATGAVSAALRFPAECVAYTGNLENHPSAVARLAEGRELLGNTPATLSRVRDPAALAGVVGRAGCRFPRTLAPGERVPAGGAWLRKPRRGGGGQGVRPIPGGAVVSARVLAQEVIEGSLGSVSFLADGRHALLLGVAHGLAGEPAFGARGFRYCGSLFPFSIGPLAAARLDAVAQAATLAFGLRGLNGVDFILQGDEPVVLEVNPRHSASMELIERAGASDFFALHAEACRGRLPSRAPRLAPACFGKAVVWARRDLELGDTRDWLARDDVRDVPFPGERIRRGEPICTVLAKAPDLQQCRARLVDAARSVVGQTAPSLQRTPA